MPYLTAAEKSLRPPTRKRFREAVRRGALVLDRERLPLQRVWFNYVRKLHRPDIRARVRYRQATLEMSLPAGLRLTVAGQERISEAVDRTARGHPFLAAGGSGVVGVVPVALLETALDAIHQTLRTEGCTEPCPVVSATPEELAMLRDFQRQEAARKATERAARIPR